jgi:hypothetical protein
VRILTLKLAGPLVRQKRPKLWITSFLRAGRVNHPEAKKKNNLDALQSRWDFQAMENLQWIGVLYMGLSLALLAVSIYMIILFVGACHDVRKIRIAIETHIAFTRPDPFANPLVTRRDSHG